MIYSLSSLEVFFQNLFQQSSNGLLSLPDEVKIGIVVVLVGLLILALVKKVFKLFWLGVVIVIIYILLTTRGII
ncbi:MAG: hypothetical protein ACK5G7_00160 [Erysipelotrichaceae bacterium]